LPASYLLYSLTVGCFTFKFYPLHICPFHSLEVIPLEESSALCHCLTVQQVTEELWLRKPLIHLHDMPLFYLLAYPTDSTEYSSVVFVGFVPVHTHTHTHTHTRVCSQSLSFLRACCYIQFYYQPYALI